ncbi:pyridoxal kinase [Microvirga tunisiensis]|uniref:Pyridoxal kinase n=2 Tax=Pannonibacter tanglangensis TaxID=2750084 RepID=A0A7X5J9Z4_9HYPH|nr:MULTISPECIES: pyridoxal kinase [unclassified Pannonibacter]NBN65866.1 pyridoxal kinase [Pannonibacter sp. XCT-34]NBN80384.1 pyridoxal kinase [Pannonibacter sp. XCT-53]
MQTPPSEPVADRPAILVITSQVVRGGIGARGAVFALERLGFPVWFLPTVLLPWHPGQGRGTRIVAPAEQFGAIAGDLARSPKLGEIGGILTGYLGDAAQAEAVAGLVKAVKAVSPDVPYLCDPVIGDLGGLYVPEETARSIRDNLLPLADISTPNRYELAWLTGREVETELQALSAARRLGPERVIVTSAPAMRRKSISNLLVGPRGAIAAEHAAVENPPHGTGDLLSALFLARRLEGLDDETALMRAAGATFEMVARSVRKGSSELLLAAEQQTIGRPMALVSTRRVLETAAVR